MELKKDISQNKKNLKIIIILGKMKMPKKKKEI